MRNLTIAKLIITAAIALSAVSFSSAAFAADGAGGSTPPTCGSYTESTTLAYKETYSSKGLVGHMVLKVCSDGFAKVTATFSSDTIFEVNYLTADYDPDTGLYTKTITSLTSKYSPATFDVTTGSGGAAWVYPTIENPEPETVTAYIVGTLSYNTP